MPHCLCAAMYWVPDVAGESPVCFPRWGPEFSHVMAENIVQLFSVIPRAVVNWGVLVAGLGEIHYFPRLSPGK